MRFWKGHGLGNDYIVVEGEDGPPPMAAVRGICDRHRGVGSDGVLVALPAAGDEAVRGLRIFNPDGTEAEKSGNGLRIFGAWLHLTGQVSAEPFGVRLPAETIEMTVEGPGSPGFLMIRVAMGRASFLAGDAGFTGVASDVEALGVEVPVEGGAADGRTESVAIHPVSMGNPHCVVFPDRLEEAAFRRLGPRLQSHPSFPAGVNVQFARVVGPGRLEAWIWERGAGETLASGSSACAVVAAARRSGRIEGSSFIVSMPGGEVEIELSPDYDVRLRGEAGIVCEGSVRDEVVAGWTGDARTPAGRAPAG